MKTSDLSMGMWEYGSMGEEKNTPTPPLPHTPTQRGRSRKLQARWHVLLLALVLGLPGWAYYSFTGATVPGRFDTVAIPLAVDGSSPYSDLGGTFTQELIQRFVGQTRLELADNENAADVSLTTRIGNYRSEPVSVSGGGRAQLVRVTVGVYARYYDNVEDQELLARTFSASVEYDPVEQGLDGEREAAVAALDIIADNIFTAATSNW